MSLFSKSGNSKQKQKTDYLQTTDTVNRPTAVLFTIIMVAVLAAAVFSLFLGGRWLYQHLDGSDKPTTTVVVTNPVTETPVGGAASTSSGSSTTSSGTTSTSSGSSTTASNSGNSTPATTTTTSSSSSAQSITATGPTETITLFIATVIIASLAHYAWQRNR